MVPVPVWEQAPVMGPVLAMEQAQVTERVPALARPSPDVAA